MTTFQLPWDNLGLPFISLLILSTSFFGSWHCAGMCSPLASIAAQKNQLGHYQLGRILSYTSLGAIAGWLGRFFLLSEYHWLQTASILLLSFLLIGLGLYSWMDYERRSKLKFNSVMKYLFMFQRRFQLSSGFSIGLFTGLFPCGWLYTFLIAAATTKSPVSGGLVMLLFCLGSVPALSAISLMVKKNISVAPVNKRRLSGAILILAGLYSLASHYLFGFHIVDSLFGL